ncbi:MAG: hypothetical protein Q4B22_12090, partial [Eubacteriales bacterium]|nr:hypothetical protein [Eubacteriales bacterium]
QRAADIPETEQRATNIPDAGHRIGDIPEAGQRIADSRAAACMEAARRTGDRYRTVDAVKTALDEVKKYWAEKVNVAFHTGNADTDRFLKWICFQPTLRRIYGCSFLPYHDYGKGGRGWRDLWQDCLALLIMDPMGVREMIVDNYCGVRIDGTNATIIGSRQGEFIADRNNITRVWMDHAFWPFLTTKLYIDQTGDTEILLEKIPYFKDLQAVRGTVHDTLWDTSDGNLQKTEQNSVYYGSIIEHILLQNLCAFYEVGEHNEIRLRGADWNDAIDMAAERGESVAFTCAYAGNLRDIAEMLRTLKRKTGITQIAAAKEMQVLFSSGKELYEDTEAKNRLLTDYAEACRHTLSGETVLLAVDEICADLEEKASWMMAHIRANEWISDAEGGGWYNSYYDNNGRQVERGRSNSDNHILQIERNTDSIEIHAEQDADSTEIHAEQDEGCVYSKTAGQIDQNQIRMMLTGQVFAIMSGTATEEQIRAITKSADTYLYDPKAGGYRLNTDFKEEKFDMGRMFGFAYGEKENGAVFSHMAVMYGNALYKQGFAGEGYKVLRSLLDTAEDFETSRMYPGIPEYFDKEGRGLYAYLTGAASWFMLTMIREVFGVRGDCGDLVIRPALLPEQFDADGNAGIRLNFAQRSLEIRLHYYKESAEGHTGEQGNESAEREKATERDKSEHLSMECAMLDERELMIKDKQEVRIARDVLEQLDPTKEHVIRVKLR